MFIKSLETNTLQLSTTYKLELKLNKTGAITNNTDGIYVKLKEITNVNKSVLKSAFNGLYVNFDTNTLELGLFRYLVQMY
jgi:hypothetical protein